MGIMSDGEPLIDDTELDGFWDKWSWTNQLYFIACEHEDDDRLVRANDATEAVTLFHADDFQHHNGRRVAYVYRLPMRPGLTGVLEWRSTDVPNVAWTDNRNLNPKGKRP